MSPVSSSSSACDRVWTGLLGRYAACLRSLHRQLLIVVLWVMCLLTVWNIAITIQMAYNELGSAVIGSDGGEAGGGGAGGGGVLRRISAASSSSSSSSKRRSVVQSSPPRRRSLPSQQLIVVPRIVHVTWFYPAETDFRFHQVLCLLAVQRFFRPSTIYFWHDQRPTGPWWLFVRQSVPPLTLVPYPRPTRVLNRTVSVPEHQSDVARLELLERYGGLYLDLDVIVVRSLDPLLHHDITLGAETPEMLGSGFILARRNSTFIDRWRSMYVTFEDSEWNYHSVVVPMRLARRHPDLVHVEWFSINRPNWFEREWLYEDGKLWDWTDNYAVHLWYREHNVDYNPISIRTLNTTVGEIFRHIYYENSRLLPNETAL